MTHKTIEELSDIMTTSSNFSDRVSAAEIILDIIKAPASHIEIQEDLLPLMSNETKTHVECDTSWPTEPLGRIENILTDGCGSVEAWDFSLANSSYEARVYFVTKVASICYGNPKALSSINLFNRLEAESHGLPSSSYEFVPVLINMTNTYVDYTAKNPTIRNVKAKLPTCIKFGEYIGKYLLTNLRALIADVGSEESLKYLNTSDEEIQIIRDNFKVFLFNVDLSTRAQMVRHRVSWQELSRRYVSGKKQPFEFYISEKMKEVTTTVGYNEISIGETIGVESLVDICTEFYYNALEKGVKPEEARRILPQAMMTTIWGAFQPSQLDNWFQLRLHKTAQREIRHVTEAMKELTCPTI